jgi:hypothetical protein
VTTTGAGWGSGGGGWAFEAGRREQLAKASPMQAINSPERGHGGFMAGP